MGARRLTASLRASAIVCSLAAAALASASCHAGRSASPATDGGTPASASTAPPVSSSAPPAPGLPVEEQLDALLASAWMQRSQGRATEASAGFARAVAMVPTGSGFEKGLWRSAAEEPVDPASPSPTALLHLRDDARDEASVLVDRRTHDVLRWFRVPDGRTHLAGDGDLLVLVVPDGTDFGGLTRMTLATGAQSPAVKVDVQAQPEGRISIAPDGRHVAYTDESQQVAMRAVADWDADPWLLEPDDPLPATVTFSGDGRKVLVVPEIDTPRGPQPQRVDLFDVESRKLLYSARTPEGTDPFHPGGIPVSQPDPEHAFSPDSRYLVVRSDRGRAWHLVETERGAIRGRSGACPFEQAPAFSADGARLTIGRCAFAVPSMQPIAVGGASRPAPRAAAESRSAAAQVERVCHAGRWVFPEESCPHP